MMRPLHRWPSFFAALQLIICMSFQISRTLASASLTFPSPTGTIRATIWEWSGSVCCSSVDNCPNKDCNYDFRICLGQPLDGQCQYANHSFVIPQAVPTRRGSYISSTKTVVQAFPIYMTNSSENEVLTISVTVQGQPKFIVLFEQKPLNLKRNKPERFQIPGLAKVDISLNMTCNPGFYGDDCTLYCEAPTPEQHYQCTDSGKLCNPGWEGLSCSEPICDDGCGDKGTCVGPNVCSCRQGWHGKKCDECVAMPGCVHGYCASEPNTCICKPNWGGPHCDKVVDKCLENPCMNGGSCKAVQLDEFTCTCPSGFTGDRCQTAVMTVIRQEQTEIRIIDHTGFWIFAVAVVLVAGALLAIWVSRRRSSSQTERRPRVGRRQSDIEMENLDDLENGKKIRRPQKHSTQNPPPYDVEELSVEMLSPQAQPPPSYEEAMGKPSPSHDRSPPPPDTNIHSHKVINELA